MRKIDLLIGALIGILSAVIGSFIFIAAFTKYHFIDGIQILHAQGNLGKVLTLGAVLSLVVFFILLKTNRELMARGVVLGTIVLTIITLFI